MVEFIEDSITEEELYSEPSQELLIIDRCPFRIFLNFEIPFDFVKPGFVCYLLSINLAAVRWCDTVGELTWGFCILIAFVQIARVATDFSFIQKER